MEDAFVLRSERANPTHMKPTDVERVAFFTEVLALHRCHIMASGFMAVLELTEAEAKIART